MSETSACGATGWPAVSAGAVYPDVDKYSAGMSERVEFLRTNRRGESSAICEFADHDFLFVHGREAFTAANQFGHHVVIERIAVAIFHVLDGIPGENRCDLLGRCLSARQHPQDPKRFQ